MRATHSGVFTLAEAAAALQLSRREATLRLGAMVRSGAIHRMTRGLFFVAPIHKWDPWERPSAAVVAAALFSPCYIGGWTAAQWWHLCSSERIETFVVTSTQARAPSVEVGGHRFHLVHVPEQRLTGPGLVPHAGGAAPMSSQERTLVDALRSPSWVGGARPLAEALRNHFRDDPDRDLFAETVLEAGNGPAVKRLTALSDLLDLQIADVLVAVVERRTRGIIDLEPGAGGGGRIDTYSGVRLNVPLDEEDPHRDFEDWGEMGDHED